MENPVTGIRLLPEISSREFTQIARSAGGPVRVPIRMTFPAGNASPARIFKNLKGKQGFLLESMEGVPRRATRSMMGVDPGGTITLPDLTPGGPSSGDDPLTFIRSSIGPGTSTDSLPGFCGGLVGYCSYDLVSAFYPGMLDAGSEEGRPPGRFMQVTSGIVIDHTTGTCTAFDTPLVTGGDDLEEIYEGSVGKTMSLAGVVMNTPGGDDIPRSREIPHLEIIPGTGREEFMEQVERVLRHIRAGDTFQTVISRRFDVPYQGDPFRVYEAVREINPSPYLYYLDFGNEAVIGSSPEMLVRVDGKKVSTVPIAGTRPRGASPAEDERLAQDLLSDEKERAEHLMLVDLARNDIGKIAAYGTVQVTSFMEVERFSHVQHITSRVSGEIRKGCDHIDALAACFPAGTVTGAPKLRAMQIIREIEADPRGLYAGAVGYIGFDASLEFAIAIRTMTVSDGIASFQTGAGIVADSDPLREFEETEKKAAALVAALNLAGGS